MYTTYTWREYKELCASSGEYPTVSEIVLDLLRRNGILKREELVYQVAVTAKISSADVNNNIHTTLNKLRRDGLIIPADHVGFWKLTGRS